MTKKSIALIGAILFAGLLTACGVADADTPASTTPSTTSTTAAPTTTVPPTTTTTLAPVDPIKFAGSYYKGAVAPLNCATNKANVAWEAITDEEGNYSEDDWESDKLVIQPAYAEFSAASITFMEALAAHDWPAVVQDDIDDLMAEMSAQATWMLTASTAIDWLTFDTAWRMAPPNEAAAIVRAKLGLPTNIGADSALACGGTYMLPGVHGVTP